MGKRSKTSPWFEKILSFFYPTSDDWYPNFPRNCVEVRLSVSHNPDKVGSIPNGRILIVVSGADDTSLEKDWFIEEATERLSKVEELKIWLKFRLPNPLTKAWLKEQGFQ